MSQAKPKGSSYRWYLFLIGCAVVFCTGCPSLLIYGLFAETVTVAERAPPPTRPEDELTDDRLDQKQPLPFDPSLVDRRPLGDWQLNQSAAVLRLDVAPLALEPDQEPPALHPSYAAAATAVKPRYGQELLPSVNLLDGKAKQFDDGLYAALDEAYYKGLDDKLHSHVQTVRRLFDLVGKDGEAAAFLAAALELAHVSVEVTDRAAKERLLRQFRADEVVSKPIGVYTLNETLADCFRFLRFLQREFGSEELAIPVALAQALARDDALLADYTAATRFYAKLTNPLLCLSLADLVEMKSANPGEFVRICQGKNVAHGSVAVFPPSVSREGLLFEKLFPGGIPPDANLMNELIRKVRSGAVDLRPRADSGWYDYQVHALETLLLPERGQEKDKLLLTGAYKKRAREAFQALITKRRETHVRQLPAVGCPAAAPTARGRADPVRPRLRVEPCPSYYLRTARAYAFLGDFLEAAVGKEALQALQAPKADGQRRTRLDPGLPFMRDLFYGLYLISAEDVGLKPSFLEGEPVDPERCYRTATDWLAMAFRDEDLAADTRVAVPVLVDRSRGVTRVWATLGVRPVELRADYVLPPKRKRLGDDWQAVDDSQLETAAYLILVDEFAEVELQGSQVLTREEFREVCDREKTREAIVAALQKRPAPHGGGWWLVALGSAAFLAAAGLVCILVLKRKRRPS